MMNILKSLKLMFIHRFVIARNEWWSTVNCQSKAFPHKKERFHYK